MNATIPDERFPVWNALSEFFLDTELDSKDYDRIGTILAESKYTEKELEEILYYEVYPACKWNMFSIAGEWDGFHPEWIMEHIAPKKDTRPRFCLAPLHRWMYQGHWKRISRTIEVKRKQKKS